MKMKSVLVALPTFSELIKATEAYVFVNNIDFVFASLGEYELDVSSNINRNCLRQHLNSKTLKAKSLIGSCNLAD
jgi:hypothetical protein